MIGRSSLSIVVCTYNRCGSLADTLASLNACELPKDCSVELLVVDNNSTDATADTCAAFARVTRVPFRRIMEVQQGLSFARNRGISEASGDAIVFTDDDVLVNAEWLAVYAREFGDTGTGCAFGRVYPDWRGHKPAWFTNELRPAYALLDYGDVRLIVTDISREFFGANFAVRRDLLVSIGGFDVQLGRTKSKLFIGEETRVFVELLRRGSRIVYNPAIVVHHVIEEARKQPAYLLRYYRDTAESLVYASLRASSVRLVLGIPLFRLRAILMFGLLALPRLAVLLLRRDRGGLFALRLNGIRVARMLVLYVGAWMRMLSTPQKGGGP